MCVLTNHEVAVHFSLAYFISITCLFQVIFHEVWYPTIVSVTSESEKRKTPKHYLESKCSSLSSLMWIRLLLAAIGRFLLK